MIRCSLQCILELFHQRVEEQMLGVFRRRKSRDIHDLSLFLKEKGVLKLHGIKCDRKYKVNKNWTKKETECKV